MFETNYHNNNMDTRQIIDQFAIDGKVLEVKPLGEGGFINDTFVVKTEGDAPDYILQRKNHIVFPNVPAMMDNIVAVTEHIKAKVADPLRDTLTIIPTKDGKYYVNDENGNFWAVCVFIKDTVTYEVANTPELARQGGIGLGLFHKQVSDFTQPLTEIIKGFHNIRWRFTQWDEAVAKDAAGRVKDLSEEISWIESRREKMLAFWEKYEKGILPARVIHGDTKISNFLFNKSDNSLLCAIDLDTMMTSTLLCDVGDALRSYTNTGAEDDKDLSKVSMSKEMYDAYIEGYLSEMGPFLSEEERELLGFGGIYITYEQVLRFLMDYIDGDKYYKIKYPEHNLVRTHAQYKLLTSMEEQIG